MAEINHAAVIPDGRTYSVALAATAGNVRVILLPLGGEPCKLTVGPCFTDNTKATLDSGGYALGLAADTFTDGNAAPAVADGVVRADLQSGQVNSVELRGVRPKSLAVWGGTNNGYVEITYERLGA